MTRSYIPLNSLRAFEAAARHLSFTHAADELNVTHSAISQQVRALEQHLNCRLFVRVSRGLTLTTEGESLLPILNDSFDRIAGMLDRFATGQIRQKLKVGAVGTFAGGFLLPRLAAFKAHCPHIDLQLSTHNNRVDPAAEGLDYTIRFGSGAWHGTEATFLCDAPLTPLCSPALAAELRRPDDVLNFTLFRSYRRDEWASWLLAAESQVPAPTHPVIVFDSSVTMLAAAQTNAGIAIAPPCMFNHLLTNGSIVQPFELTVSLGGYWLTRLQSKPETEAMRDFAKWIATELASLK
jgi:LysR family transcriptional regulator of beta-lactamase